MHRCFVLVPVIVILAAAAFVRAAPKPGDVRDTEILGTITALADDFNRSDARALATRWTPDGEIVGFHDKRVVGRDAVEAAFRGLHAAHPNCKLRLHVVSTRFVAENVALVELVAETTPAIEGANGGTTPSLVLVKTDGRWLVARMNETPSKAPSGQNHLANVKWLVGSWLSEGAGDVTVTSTCDWTARGTYLIRKFTAERKDAPARAGTEVIGWDPRRHEVRSWTFDADGGFGESTWAQDGDRWIIKYSGTRADGAGVSATHVVTVVDVATLTVQSQDRVVEGQKQPDLPTVTIKRRPAEGATESNATKPIQPPKQVLP